MFRPEYLLVGVAFAVLALIRIGRARGWKPGLAGAALLVAALLLPIVPWAIRNQVVLTAPCRSRPAAARRSTSAPSCPPTANTSESRRSSPSATCTANTSPHSQALEEVDPKPLFNRVAGRYPDLPRDSALGKIGKQNFSHYFGEDPVEYLAMTVRKTWRMWSAGIGEAMESSAGRIIQTLIVAPRPRRPHRARLATLVVGAGRDGDADRPRHRRRRDLAGRAPPQRGADDADLSARRRGALTGDGRPIVQAAMTPYAGIFPAELTALRSVGLIGGVALVVYAVAGAARCATSTC